MRLFRILFNVAFVVTAPVWVIPVFAFMAFTCFFSDTAEAEQFRKYVTGETSFI